MKRSEIPLLLAASLVFADATIVTLALPDLLVDLRTTVYGVAAVLGVYTATVGSAALPAAWLVRRAGHPWTGTAALCAFSLASLACAFANGLVVLLIARAIQGVAGALVLTVAGAALASRRSWVSIAVLSGAVGPVVGGALTQAFSWRAIFIAQAPVPLVAAALRKPRSHVRPDDGTVSHARTKVRPLLVLGLVSGALTALLFGVVLLLVVGWAMRPLSAALTVTLVPAAAFLGSLPAGRAQQRVVAGCALIGGGVGALAFLPSNDVTVSAADSGRIAQPTTSSNATPNSSAVRAPETRPRTSSGRTFACAGEAVASPGRACDQRLPKAAATSGTGA